MTRKVHEISFAIMGQLASSFRGSFSQASTAINALKRSISDLNEQYRSGTISIEDFVAQHKKLTRQLEQAYTAQRRLNDAMETQSRLGSMMRGARERAVRTASFINGRFAAGLGVLGLGVGVGAAVGSSFSKAMDYEQELSNIQAVAGLTAQQMQQMNQLALRMGAQTKYSALEAAQGIEELLKAGMSPATVQAGGLEAALNLATAGGLDLADAANIMSNALNGFRKDGMSAADAANILAGAANASSADVQSLAYGLEAVGPVADGIGVSFKQVNAVLAAFSNNALQGSDAGTSLKTFLQNVQPQTKQATALFERYGLITKNGTNILFKANGQLKDMAEVAQILHDHFRSLNDEQRTNAFFNMFGSDAVRAVNILYKEGAKGIKDMYNQMSKVTALDVARQKMNNAAGAVEQFKGAIETLQISALMPTLPIIKNLANAAADFVAKYTPMITSGIQHAVDDARRYLHVHFLDNPEFQHLPTLSSKIHFVFDDLMKSFSAWLSNGGNAQIQKVTSWLINGLISAINAATPEIAQAAIRIGIAIVKAVGTGIATSVRDHTEILTKGILSGGPIGLVAKGLELIRGHHQSSTTSGPHPHKDGGIFNKPHIGLVAEAGPEAIIPLNGSPRAKSLWQQAGTALGMGMGDIHVTYAPVVYGAGPEIMPELQKQQKSFMEELKAVIHQQRRVSFSG